MRYAGHLFLPALLLLAVPACEPADNTPPAVVSTYPANGATGVPVNAKTRVTFSEAMDTASTEAAFGIAPDIAGTFEWAANSMYFRPAQDFAAGTAYSVTVDTTAADAAGNRLDLAPAVGFTTGDATAPPVMVYMLGRSVMGN